MKFCHLIFRKDLNENKYIPDEQADIFLAIEINID